MNCSKSKSFGLWVTLGFFVGAISLLSGCATSGDSAQVESATQVEGAGVAPAILKSEGASDADVKAETKETCGCGGNHAHAKGENASGGAKCSHCGDGKMGSEECKKNGACAIKKKSKAQK